MPVLSDATVEVSHKGDVPSRIMETAMTKVRAAADRCREPVRHIEIRLTMEPSPTRERPAQAEATIDVEGSPVRAHLAATTLDEAVDLLVDRLRRRLQRHEERRHRKAERHRTGDSGPGEWRHGDLPSNRPEFLDIPVDEREVRRQKTFAVDPISIDEALFDLEQLGHEFYLFVDAASGCECVLRHQVDEVELLSTEPGSHADDQLPEGVRLGGAPPQLDLSDAKERLEASGEPHVFFTAPEADGARVLYRRFDGHYGLVTLA